MLRELWAEQVSNDEVLKKLETKGTLILNIKKRHFEISRAHNKKRGCGKFDTHRTEEYNA